MTTLRGNVKWLLRNFERLVMRPTVLPTPWWMWPAAAYTVSDPRGVVVIFTPWNFPIALSLEPLAGALLTGNSVVLKLSESSPHLSRALARMLPRYVDPSCLRVVLGGAAVSRALVEQPVDFVFFTGGNGVGAAIAESCGRRLIPFVLELGGKCPVVVFPDADMTAVARRVAQGRFFNAGQLCVSGDYVLVVGDEARRDEVVRAVSAEVRRQLGRDARASPDYSRIVNAAQFDRLVEMIPSADRKPCAGECSCAVAHGGAHDRAALYVEPTLLTLDAAHASRCRAMRGEIFGPVLPFMAVPDAAAAAAVIRSRAKPLQVYVFTRSRGNADYLMRRTQSSCFTVNDVLMGIANYNAPFGTCGFGAYHGPHTFTCFAHVKPVTETSVLVDSEYRYPPKLGSKAGLAGLKLFDWVL